MMTDSFTAIHEPQWKSFFNCYETLSLLAAIPEAI